MPVLWIAVKCSAGTLGNTGKMTKQNALCGLSNGCIQSSITTYAFHKIVEVKEVQVTTGADRVGRIVFGIRFYFFHQLIIVIKYFVIIITVIYQRSFISVNNKPTARSFCREDITTTALPVYRGLIAKLKTGHL